MTFPSCRNIFPVIALAATSSLAQTPQPNPMTNDYVGKLAADLSPAHNVRAGLPPTITFHGTGDTTTPFKGAQMFHDAMRKAGNRSELVVNEGGAHGYLMRTQTLYDECLGKSDAFLSSLGLVTAGERTSRR